MEETEEIIAKIEAVTAEDVLEAAKAVLRTEEMSFSAVGNLKGTDFGALVKRSTSANIVRAIQNRFSWNNAVTTS